MLHDPKFLPLKPFLAHPIRGLILLKCAHCPATKDLRIDDNTIEELSEVVEAEGWADCICPACHAKEEGEG